ncbi:MAG: hypothetical protein Q8S13_04490 [Dehalococcoidia bacterium]|nr:hypothetical protein [Dehalococcoidia bacterium]
MASRSRLAVAALVIALGLFAAEGWAARGIGRFDVVECTTTRSHVTGGNAARTALTMQNVGTANIYLGFGGGPATLTAANGWTLHAGSALELGGPKGGDPTTAVECISSDVGLGQRLQLLEEY